MNKINTIIITFILIFLVSIQSYSQEGLSIKLGTAIPAFNYYEVPGTSSAGVGLNFNVKYSKYILNERLGVFASTGITYSGIKRSKIKYLEKIHNSNELEMTFSKNFDIPLLIGGSYDIFQKEQFSLNVEYGMGINMVKSADVEIRSGDYFYKRENHFSIGYGFKPGLNFILKDRFIISFDYYLAINSIKSSYLDAYKYEYSVYTSKDERKNKMILICFGYKF